MPAAQRLVRITSRYTAAIQSQMARALIRAIVGQFSRRCGSAAPRALNIRWQWNHPCLDEREPGNRRFAARASPTVAALACRPPPHHLERQKTVRLGAATPPLVVVDVHDEDRDRDGPARRCDLQSADEDGRHRRPSRWSGRTLVGRPPVRGRRLDAAEVAVRDQSRTLTTPHRDIPLRSRFASSQVGQRPRPSAGVAPAARRDTRGALGWSAIDVPQEGPSDGPGGLMSGGPCGIGGQRPACPGHPAERALEDLRREPEVDGVRRKRRRQADRRRVRVRGLAQRL